MRIDARILFLLLLLSPVIVEESRLLVLRSGARWETPRPNSGPYFQGVAKGIGADGSAWSVIRSGGSGGSNTDLSIVDSSGKKLEWWSNSESGHPQILVSNSAGKTRFLCYQYYWIGSNHVIGENPWMVRYGIWLVEPGPEGYRLTPIVRNPVSLIVREPVYLLVILDRLIDRIFR